MKIYNFEQRTDDWFAVRQLKMTASNGTVIYNAGKGLETYIDNLVAEYISGVHEEIYTNADMQRGVELEPIAREKACEIAGLKFQEVGFVEHDQFIGVSPDGVVFDKDKIKVICELKCPNNKRFIEQLVNDAIPTDYIYQMQMQLMVTQAKQCLYLAYNENVKPYVFYKWVKPDEEVQKKLKLGLEKGKQLINKKLLDYYSAVERELNK